MDVAQIAKVTSPSPGDRVREVITNFDEDGFDSLYPKYAGARRPTFTLPQHQQIKKIALSRTQDEELGRHCCIRPVRGCRSSGAAKRCPPGRGEIAGLAALIYAASVT